MFPYSNNLSLAKQVQFKGLLTTCDSDTKKSLNREDMERCCRCTANKNLR